MEVSVHVVITRNAIKDLAKVPIHIQRKLQLWVMSVKSVGLEETRKISGYHDEPLRGKREGQRSIRLSQAYRAFYRRLKDGKIEFIQVEEVNKHEY